jgi:hypothetical protein
MCSRRFLPELFPKEAAMEKIRRLKVAPKLETPIDLPSEASRAVSTALNELIAGW